MLFRLPRGTADILPRDQALWRVYRGRAEELAYRYGYERVDTPVFEDAGLFERGVGANTDIVQKQMYTFEDRGGSRLTLRPEGTASVCRAYLEHGMHKLVQPVKFHYFGPIFRYERPQKGRLRQHQQFGVEALGDADPALDAEVIDLAWTLYAELGLRQLQLHVNSIGCPVCRPAYVDALRSYYLPLVDSLCSDCRSRVTRSPLRLLDCKEDSCQSAADSAPRSSDYLCSDCRAHYGAVQRYLGLLEIPYQDDHRLVRGLDYYTRTVFELKPATGGQQSTLVGGGRYDGLIEELGGPPTPGIGFGAGIERALLELRQQGVVVPEQRGPQVFVAHVGEPTQEAALDLLSRLRRHGLAASGGPSSKSLKAQMRQANALAATYALILGDEELRTGTVILRHLHQKTQQRVLLDDVVRLFSPARDELRPEE